jgi:hypothetical protein
MVTKITNSEKYKIKIKLIYLGTSFTSRFGFRGHGALHLHGQSHILELDSLNFNALFEKKRLKSCGDETKAKLVKQTHGSVASSRHSRMALDTDSRSCRISDRDFCPRTFLKLVCASKRVDSCAFSTLATDTAGLKTR